MYFQNSTQLGWWFLAELIGTFILIIFGNGAVAQVNLKKMATSETKAKFLTVALTWGIGVLFGVLTANAIFKGSGHLNPAISLFYAINGSIKSPTALIWPGFVIGILAQFLGAMIAQTTLNFLFWKQLSSTDPQTVLAMHCTSPSVFNITRNFLTEFIATLILIGGVVAASHFLHNNPNSVPPGFMGLWLVAGIIIAFGGATGSAINPARDLGTRIVFQLTPIKNKDANWKYSWIPVIAPLSAGLVLSIIIGFSPAPVL
ncbi:MIP/aquaporin family protein [Mycoplasmoides genitalium]|uniref:Probable glycerol uptake facilitator protein n=2 Tax=Mycoplasmoides genitalium TaxID=2097 RepID=GLPF_MYCGE|nr:MIP/aquaporin family protein [Mycoplasmoides genitalium]P47279.2 RecName: Full=Probable glycerol uptake facilitator protein [Mycoplasmoides genitalium G37]ABY79648.1 glycerol uptake facilitator [synthetic Mycoplasma genitalium JCVI-1.0]AAC71249.1 glycerol uptake facilitator [Mycoplasmoides genitalium G37]AFQ02841.1 glycerol uptake facilitator [Mycoplasmoides genitalium M2321]AFQ03825.1 glycerol uptake facilitator [Mycoplasmoides genitalium M6320]